ncbi:probable G-protein coupled receptor 34 [Hippoglossus stenolepis]|uniref:probable G-protein coupled receptor 34 n=1 Tax=Hippoglossus stenolepis TaxID=195615 RepID=UPI00159C8BF5|nr:probable G-protein coupled receptor 34 [Hippoglossus stenolepis]XP_035006281.1 probable G-protein coupled receptor 34 [Hippoglossus stenolepis]
MTTFAPASSFPFTLSASASSNTSLSASSLPLSMSSFPPPFSTISVVSPNQTCLLDDNPLRWTLAIFYSLFFLFGIVGNVFALWVFLHLHSSRNSVRVFLINCAVADLVLLACLPFRVFYHVNGNKWVLGKVACKLVGTLFYMNMYISITLLGFISLDRYLRLKRKGRARRGVWGSSRSSSWVACGVLWGLSLTALVCMIVKADGKENSDLCFQYKQLHKAKGKAYFNAVLVVLFWFVFIMLVVSYAKIACQLLRVSRDRPDLPNARKYNCTAKKSFFVLFLFTVCFGPYHAFRPFYIHSQLSRTISCDYQQLMNRTNEVMLLFSAFNSCLDPVMYFLLSGSVRKTALQALGHRFGNRLFLHDATSNSSTTEFRRPSVPMGLPKAELNIPSVTPRVGICVISSTLDHTGSTVLPPTGQN